MRIRKSWAWDWLAFAILLVLAAVFAWYFTEGVLG